MRKIFDNQFLKFATVGIISTLIHSTVYFLTFNIINLNPQFSNLIGFTFAFIFSYLGQRFWTFGGIKIKSETASKIKFLISALLSYFLNSLWVFIVEKILKISPNYAIIGVLFITPIVTFITLKLWVFKNEN